MMPIKLLLVIAIISSAAGDISKDPVVLQEGFNSDTFPPAGWHRVILAGTHNWQRTSSNINPPCLPLEGSGMASYPSYSAPEGSRARLITKPIFLGTGLYRCSLRLYMFHDPGYSDCADRIIIETSQDLVNFSSIDSVLRYQPSSPGWEQHKFYLGNFTDSIYVSLLAYSEYGNNMNIDYLEVTKRELIAGRDIGVEEIILPLSYHGINTPIVPRAVIKNYGYRAQENFWVVCSIFGISSGPVLYYVDSILIPVLPSNAQLGVNFMPWLPMACETVMVKITTNLLGDANPLNNTKIRVTEIRELLNIISPNGGEFFRGSGRYLIRWCRNFVNFSAYTLIFSQDSGISYPETIAQNLNGTDTVYEWLVPQYNLNACRIRILGYDSLGNLWANDESDSNFTIDAIAPTRPELIYPENNGYYNDSFVVFIWYSAADSGQVSSGIQGYELEVTCDSGFTNSILIQSEDTLYACSILLPDSIYYWRVRAIDHAGNYSTWSDVWCFEIDTRRPNVPVLLAPINGIWLNDSVVVFSYDTLGCGCLRAPIYYLLQVDTSINFITPIVDSTSILVDTMILRENKYFWRIRAYDLAGNLSDFSGPDSFGVDYTGPETPILITPASNAVLQDSVVYFSWHRSDDNLSGVWGYEIELATDSNFSWAQVFFVVDTSWSLVFTTADTYYWRLRAQDRAHNFSAYSEIRSFRIEFLGINEMSCSPTLSKAVLLVPSVTRRTKDVLINIYLAKPNVVALNIYDLSGKLIRNLFSGRIDPDGYGIFWDLTDNNSLKVPPGVYFANLDMPYFQVRRKIIVLK
ncbi:MAG: hypothetical protein ABIK73_03860 [candidate division WOR-3 bacterium]